MMEVEQLRWVTAKHEAGHAVMRWILGLQATDIHVGSGDGLCEGTGDCINPEDALLVTLAGYATELGLGSDPVDFSRFVRGDFEEAREILTKNIRLRLNITSSVGSEEEPQQMQYMFPNFLEVEDSLQVWFRRCSSEMLPYVGLVEEIAAAAVDGHLSAVDLQAILDQYTGA